MAERIATDVPPVIQTSTEWRRVASWPYEVSADGQVRHATTGQVRRVQANKHSQYLQFGVWAPGDRVRTLKVHRLVAEVFLGPCPAGQEVNHIDGNKANNAVENLEYVTRSENCHHAHRNGLNGGVRHRSAKLSRETVEAIKATPVEERTRGWISCLARQHSVTPSAVCSLLNGRSWKYV